MRHYARLRDTDKHLHLTDDAQLTLCGRRVEVADGGPVVVLEPGDRKRCPVCERLAGQAPLFAPAPLFGWPK